MSDEANDFGTFAVCCVTDDKNNVLLLITTLEKRQRFEQRQTLLELVIFMVGALLSLVSG